MLALALTFIVSAADVAVVERSTLGLPPAAGAELRAKLAKALADASVQAEVVNEACADRGCLQSLARERKQVVVGMTIVKSKKGVTVDLDAVDGEAVVLQQTFLVINTGKFERSPEAQVFAHQLSTRLVKQDAPVVEVQKPNVREPVVTPRDELFVEEAPRSRSAAPVVLGVSSGVVGVAGVVLLVAGGVNKGQLDASLAQQPVMGLTRTQAQAQADAANALTGSGAVALGLGVAGAVTAVIVALAQAE